MIIHKIKSHEQTTTYTAKVKMMKSKFDRVNRLLKIKNLDDYSDEELERMGAKKDDTQFIFGVQFDDNSTLDWQLCSGDVGYFDNVIFKHPEGQWEDLDCTYELDNIEIDSGNNIYKVIIEIDDDTDIRMWDARFWNKDEMLWNSLYKHRHHNVSIACYGNEKNPADVCLECEDCNEVILDGELYTLAAREDIN